MIETEAEMNIMTCGNFSSSRNCPLYTFNTARSPHSEVSIETVPNFAILQLIS